MLKSTYDFDRSIINHAVHTSTYGTSDNKVFLLPKKKQNKAKQNSSNQSYKNKIVRCHTLLTVHEAFSTLIMIMTLLKKCKKPHRHSSEIRGLRST